MSSNHSYIISLCQKISESGKTPSLALVRNKADRPLAIPEVIQTLKSWKENPEQVVEEMVEEAPTSELSLENRVAHLEQQVKRLEAMLKSLQK